MQLVRQAAHLQLLSEVTNCFHFHFSRLMPCAEHHHIMVAHNIVEKNPIIDGDHCLVLHLSLFVPVPSILGPVGLNG